MSSGLDQLTRPLSTPLQFQNYVVSLPARRHELPAIAELGAPSARGRLRDDARGSSEGLRTGSLRAGARTDG